MYQIAGQNEWQALDNLGVFNSSGDTIIDPDLVEDLAGEFQDFDVDDTDIKEAAEKANIRADKALFYFIDRTNYDEIREVLEEEYGNPDDLDEYKL